MIKITYVPICDYKLSIMSFIVHLSIQNYTLYAHLRYIFGGEICTYQSISLPVASRDTIVDWIPLVGVVVAADTSYPWKSDMGSSY